MGFTSKLLPGPLTDFGAWMGFCTSSPLQGVKYTSWDIWIFFGGVLLKSNEKFPKDGNDFSHWDLDQRFFTGLYQTKVSGWDSAPAAHSRVSNINFDSWIWVRALLISYEQFPKDGKVLSHLAFTSKVFPGPLMDLSAYVGFCTSSP